MVAVTITIGNNHTVVIAEAIVNQDGTMSVESTYEDMEFILQPTIEIPWEYNGPKPRPYWQQGKERGRRNFR